jgi:hypothetical protein
MCTSVSPYGLYSHRFSGCRWNLEAGSVKGKVVPVLNWISTIPWRHMGEWRYSSTFLDLGTRWRWVVSFTHLPLYPRGERAPGTHWIKGWVGPIVGLDAVKKRKILHGLESYPGRPGRRYTDWAVNTINMPGVFDLDPYRSHKTFILYGTAIEILKIFSTNAHNKKYLYMA